MATARSAPGPGTSQAFSGDSPPPGGDPGYGNQPPWADDDYYSVLHDQTLSDPAPGVLWNDYDPDGDPLTAQLVSGPQNGSVTLNPDGSFTYEPNPGFAGQDSFTYQAHDGTQGSNTATVWIDVVNTPPQAIDDGPYLVTYESPLEVAASQGVLANDYDPDGDALTAQLVSGPQNGTVTLNPDGSFIYEPNPGFSGQDSFTYQATDGIDTSLVAMVTLDVSAVDLDIYKPKVIDEAEPAVPEKDELAVGAQTWENLDNDDNDTTYDIDDQQVANGDNELAKLVLKVNATAHPQGTARLQATQGGGNIRVWTSPNKGTQYRLGDPLDLAQDFQRQGDSWVKTLWVEGIAPHTQQRGTRLELTLDNSPQSDQVALTVLGVKKLDWIGQNNSVDSDNTLDPDPNFANNMPEGFYLKAVRVFPGARLGANGQVGPKRDKVTLQAELTVKPVEPVKVYFRSFDVDDPTADTGPVDDPGASTGEQQPEDNRRNFGDATYNNRTIVRAGQFLGTTDSYGILELTFAQQTATVDFQVSMQPGDNYRVAASPERQFLLELANDDKLQNLGANTKERNANKQRIVIPGMVNANDPASVAQAELRKPQNYTTDVLTTWRFVHVEVDSMGPVQGNHMTVTVAGRVIGNDGKITIVLDKNLGTNNDFPVNRFENGTYTDLTTGLQYDIVANANDYRVAGNNNPVSYLVLNPRADGRLPSANGQAKIVDDDHLVDGQDVPMPNTGQLQRALQDAFIVPVIRQDNDEVTFAANADRFVHSPPAVVQLNTLYDWDDASYNSTEYWATYLFGAFQPHPLRDNDPRAETALLGVWDAWNRGEATVFLETIRDVVPEWNQDQRFQQKLPQPLTVQILEQETVVHEMGHVLASDGQDDPNYFDDVHEGPTRLPNELFRYSDIYLDKIRSNRKPG